MCFSCFIFACLFIASSYDYVKAAGFGTEWTNCFQIGAFGWTRKIYRGQHLGEKRILVTALNNLTCVSSQVKLEVYYSWSSTRTLSPTNLLFLLLLQLLLLLLHGWWRTLKSFTRRRIVKSKFIGLIFIKWEYSILLTHKKCATWVRYEDITAKRRVRANNKLV